MTSFEEAAAFLEARNLGYRQGYEYVGAVGVDRHQEDRHYFEAVEIPFSAEEWLDTIDADGEVLPRCCGTISAARDILLSCLRGGRWIESADLWHFVQLLSNHDGFEFMLPRDKVGRTDLSASEEEGRSDPIYRLWEVYDKLKDHLVLRVPTVAPLPETAPLREKPEEEALSILYTGISALFWSTSCFSKGREDDPEWMKQQKHSARQLTIARLVPALRSVLEHIDRLDLGDFDGFALCKKDEPDVVLDNVLGLCIYRDRSEAQEMIEIWSKRDDEHKEDSGRRNVRENAIIRPVHVSSKTGLTFTDQRRH